MQTAELEMSAVDTVAKLQDDRAKLLIACRTALVRMRRGGFHDAIAEHVLQAAIRRAEPEHV